MREELLAQKNSLRNRRDRALEKRVLADYPLVQTVSEYAADIVRQVYGLKAQCCYPPVLTATADVNQKPVGPWTVGCIATFAERKNFLNVWRALKIVKTKNPEIHIRIGVANPTRLIEYLKTHGFEMSSDIEVVNTFRAADLHQFYQSLDLNLYLTLDEPLGLIPIEAALCCTPSLLSDHAGPGELSKLGLGTSVNPLDEDAIVFGILNRATHRLTTIERQKLQQSAQDHFGVKAFLSRFDRQIDSLFAPSLPLRTLPDTTNSL
jgi:glycosyltransferase involved in cell wall biosynthesis